MKKGEVVKESKRAIAAKVTEEWMTNLPENIRGKLNAALLSLLGLEGSYGHVTVDHCNGRASVLIDIIRERAKTEVMALLGKVKLDATALKPVETALQKEYAEQFKSALRDALRNKARDDANAYAAKIAADALAE